MAYIPAFTEMLERLYVLVLDTLYVDTTDPLGSLEGQKEDARNFLASSAERATLSTIFDPFQFKDASVSSLNGTCSRSRMPLKKTIIKARDHLLEINPGLRVIDNQLRYIGATFLAA